MDLKITVENILFISGCSMRNFKCQALLFYVFLKQVSFSDCVLQFLRLTLCFFAFVYYVFTHTCYLCIFLTSHLLIPLFVYFQLYFVVFFSHNNIGLILVSILYWSFIPNKGHKLGTSEIWAVLLSRDLRQNKLYSWRSLLTLCNTKCFT